MKSRKQPHLFLSAVVVVTPGHLNFVENCLEDILGQTYPFSEVIIIASGFRFGDKSVLSKLVSQLPIDIIRLEYLSAGSAGRNRNSGLALVNSRSDLVFFHDADDRYAVHRNEVAVEVYLETNFDALSHFYIGADRAEIDVALRQIDEARKEFDRQMLIRPENLYYATFQEKARDRQREVLGLESATLRIDGQFGEPLIQHAHAIVSKKAFSDIVFHERYVPRNEDSLMLRDLLFSGKKVIVLCKPLSIWVKGTSSYNFQYKWRHLALRIRQILFRLGRRSNTA